MTPPRNLPDHVIIMRMSEALIDLDDLDNDCARAAAYHAADIDARDIADLDRFARHAEELRRVTFSKRFSSDFERVFA
jgi:hypothetical protein